MLLKVLMSLLIAPLEALTDELLSDPERRVLLALFSFRGKTTELVWPSTEEIAGRANIKDKTWISKLTKSLSEKGWLEKRKRGFTGGNEYKLKLPARFCEDASPNLDSEPKLGANTNSNLGSQSNSNLDSEPKCNEQTIEQTNEQTIKKITKKNLALDVFEFWKETMNHTKAKLDDKRLKLITKSLDLGYTADDLKCAITGCAKSEYHMGKNDNGTVYDDLGLILRDAGKIDFFIKKSTQVTNHAANQFSRGADSGPNKTGAADLVRTQARKFFEQNRSVGGSALHPTG